MSKKSFSQKAYNLMINKIEALDEHNFNYFFDNDECFEFMLCLAYLTLSKEKIIRKEINNDDRLGRLTNYVDMESIDKLFKPGFSANMPKIISTLENNNLWILDNIRDSIMHGVFDIDENNRCLIIENNLPGRNFKAEIPFSWIIDYAKNDILSKKKMDKYVIKGCYYNMYHFNKKHFESKKEVYNTVLYNVIVTGTQFNVKDVEKRVIELFETYSHQKVNYDDIQYYQSELIEEQKNYDVHYLTSFYRARNIVKETIEKEFPGTSVDIYKHEKKHKIANKAIRNLPTYISNYDGFIEHLNKVIRPKGISLLYFLTNFIENFDKLSSIDYNGLPMYNLKKEIIKHISNTNCENSNDDYIFYTYENTLDILKNISIQILGLSTLVINHDDLYKQHYPDYPLSNFRLEGYTKESYRKSAEKVRSTCIEILETEEKITRRQDQLAKCPEDKKQTIRENISKLEKKLDELYCKMELPYENLNRSKKTEFNETRSIILHRKLKEYIEAFKDTPNADTKKILIPAIKQLMTWIVEEDKQFTSASCQLHEAITTIRNSLSHIGRMYIGKNKFGDTYIIFYDYDNDKVKSGEISCSYDAFIQLIGEPLKKQQGLSRKVCKLSKIPYKNYQ